MALQRVALTTSDNGERVLLVSMMTRHQKYTELAVNTRKSKECRLGAGPTHLRMMQVSVSRRPGDKRLDSESHSLAEWPNGTYIRLLHIIQVVADGRMAPIYRYKGFH